LGVYLKEMTDEQDQMRQLITTLMWHMRGSVSRQEAWTLSPHERQDIIKSIEERKETTEKTGLALM
jgi:hypothetical protein